MDITPEGLAEKVAEIIAADKNADSEAAHALEDELFQAVAEEFAPHWVLAELVKLATSQRTRWFA